jgi:hypothetical protein
MTEWAQPIHCVAIQVCTMLGVSYFIVKNVPNIINSSFANVHLVALCYSPDLKTYDFSAVLRKFVEEMKRPSSEGFVVIFLL